MSNSLLKIELLTACELLRMALKNPDAVKRYENKNTSKWTKGGRK